jgi:hypothetical protein
MPATPRRSRAARLGRPAERPVGSCELQIMWKSSRAPKNPPLRRFVQSRGSRRLGDHIAYVTNPQLLSAAPAVGEWTEDKGFDEKVALRDWPGIKVLFDQARRNGIALCIKG